MNITLFAYVWFHLDYEQQVERQLRVQGFKKMYKYIQGLHSFYKLVQIKDYNL